MQEEVTRVAAALHLDSVINSLLYDAKESENVKQAVAHVVKKRKCDGDGDRSDGDARSRNLVGNRSRTMTSIQFFI